MAMLSLDLPKWANLSQNYIWNYLLRGENLMQHDTSKQSRENRQPEKIITHKRMRVKKSISRKSQKAPESAKIQSYR